MKKIAAVLSAILIFTLTCCKQDVDMTYGDPNANRIIPSDTQATLSIERDENNKNISVFGLGTEVDPHFFYGNVGRSGVSDVGAWECKESDWQLFESRMSEMNLKRIRMMLLPSWFCPSESNYLTGNYNYTSAQMKSVCKLMDTAESLGIKVNVTMWGVDSSWLRTTEQSDWVTYPKSGKEEVFVGMFADCIKYLIEEKNYDCIKEVTLYNEPNSLYYGNSAVDDYVDICKKMNDAFIQKGIRDKVLFDLSDDARSPAWMAQTLYKLDGITDVVNSHVYTFGDTYDEKEDKYILKMSNRDICYNLPNYNLDIYKQLREGYENIPHIFGEFGTCNGTGSHTATDVFRPERGLDIAKIALNMFNMGSAGMSYWVLFSQYYSEAASEQIMNMGLWGFADENYNCRPMYYAYSMLTRFIGEGNKIYPIVSGDGNIVAAAFRNGDNWSYCVVNDGDTAKKISFLNNTAFKTEFDKYVYDIIAVPTDNKVIASSGKLNADGRVLTDNVPAGCFIVYKTT